MSQDSKRITEAQVRREWRRIDNRAARRRTRIGAAVILAVALVAGALAAKFLFIALSIRSDGMSGTLDGGDVALCVRIDAPYLQGRPERDGLALVRYSESGLHRLTVRRLIALGGDVVSVDSEGRVTRNGTLLDEPYATYRPLSEQSVDRVVPGGALENPFASDDDQVQAPAPDTAEGTDDMEFPLIVPEGTVFVLCDNRNNLLDSRSSRFGLVKEADIKGAARAIVWPVYRAGRLDDAPVVK